ncbi:hypothetical protein TNCV_864651 [Trichonephila clavipes]|nr:hypothetical protein TNCV_864651 [Trichonephila clavipes]
MEQSVLDTVRRNPSTNVQTVAAAVSGSRSSLHCVTPIVSPKSTVTVPYRSISIVHAAADISQNPGVFDRIH